MRHTIAGSGRGSATLRLVAAGGDQPQAPRFAETAVRRPGDRHDSWPVNPRDIDALHRLGCHGDRRGLTLDVAATLVIEHGLVLDELQAFFGEATLTATDELDARANDAGRRVPLGGPNADYLRALMRAGRERGSASAQPAASTTAPYALALPLRLLDRLDEATVRRALERGALSAARRWEAAATAAGQTMSEWAAWQTAAFAVRLAASAR